MARGLHFWSESTKDKQSLWTAATQWLNSNNLRNRHLHKESIVSLLRDWRWKKVRCLLGDLNPWPCAPHFGGERLFWLCFSGIPAPWHCGWMVEWMHRDLAFLETGVNQIYTLYSIPHSIPRLGLQHRATTYTWFLHRDFRNKWCESLLCLFKEPTLLTRLLVCQFGQ